MKPKALLLIGSPKPGSSTSESIGNYLLEQLQKRGIEGEKAKLIQIIKNDEMKKFISVLDNYDIIILSCPLYVDSAPAIVIKAMEFIFSERKSLASGKRPKMIAISNCGFPEAHQNNTSLEIYHHFAKHMGFEWAGGLTLGGGGAIDGRPLNSLGGMVKNVLKSLDLTAATIAEGKHIPEEANRLMQLMIPHWLYCMVGNYGWRIQAKKHGVYRELHNKPYEAK